MAPPARLLDLTRQVARMGKGRPTGIDRVDLAYLTALLARPEALFGLVRTPLGYLALDRRGCQAVLDRALAQVAVGAPDALGWLMRRHDRARAGAEADLRRLAVARCSRWGLRRMIARHLPAGGSYLNLGHSNLDAHTLAALAGVQGLRLVVMLHDTIPLDHPDLCRAGTQPVFAAKLAQVARHAHLVIHTAQATRRATEAHLARAGRVPPGLVVPLGITPVAPGPLPPGLRPDRPWFVALGTIEPRKNLGLLLEVWHGLAARLPPAQVPVLLILGRRGWAGPALLAALDAGLPQVREIPGLPDDQVAALLAGSRGLLFPSLAEGYGLPPLEAAALGVPVFCSDLPVLREMLGDWAVYLNPVDSYSWMETIVQALQSGAQGAARGPLAVPDWKDHLDLVLGRV